jgi:hypothetical protein
VASSQVLCSQVLAVVLQVASCSCDFSPFLSKTALFFDRRTNFTPFQKKEKRFLGIGYNMLKINKLKRILARNIRHLS